MSIFSKPFFSIAGQIERVKNVGATLNAAFNPFASNKGVTANISNPTVKKVLETVASHPYVSAGVVTAGITTALNPKIIIPVVKALIPKSTIGKVIEFTALPTIIGAGATLIKENPTGALDTLLSAPNKGFNAGQDLIKIINEPSLETGIEYIKAHPYLSATALTAGLAALGFGGLAIAKLISTYSNTKAINENTELNKNPPTNNNLNDNNDYKDQLKLIEAQTKSQKEILEAQTKQAKELSKLNVPPVVAPVKEAPSGAISKKKKKKKKKTTKKKTRRSKKKRKTIKRRKHK